MNRNFIVTELNDKEITINVPEDATDEEITDIILKEHENATLLFGTKVFEIRDGNDDERLIYRKDVL